MQKINPDVPLAVWLKNIGGLNPTGGDRTGEIRSITEARRGYPPGMLNKKATLSLDQLAQRAFDDGYLADNTEAAFLEALADDIAAKCNNQPHRRIYTWESPRRYKLQEDAYMAAQEVIETTAITVGAPGTRTVLDAEALLRAELEEQRRLNAELKEARRKGVYLKVSEKGGVSICGLRKFPITLYKEELALILDMRDTCVQFMVDHDSELSTKD